MNMDSRIGTPKRRRARRQVATAVLLGGVVTLLVAGCTSSKKSPPSSGSASAPAVAKNQTITVALPALAPQTPDPDLATGSASAIRVGVGEGLVRPDNSGTFVPGLATSWDISPDKLTWTFHLRSGVKMQDGSDFTAQDVKTTIGRITDAPVWTSYAAYRANLVSVEVVDPLTVKITTKAPDGSLPQNTPAPVATEYYNKVGEKAFELAPIAAGPFKFVSQVLNSSMTFDVFKGFWDKSRIPNFSHLELKVIPEESTRLAALQSGQIDLAPLTPQSSSQLKGSADLKVVSSKNDNQANLFFPDNYTGKSSPLRDQNVRQALLLAIDRSAIANSLYSGYAHVPGSPLFPTAPGYDSSVKPYPFDPAKAKQLLQQAGVPNLSLTLHTYNASTGVPQVPSLVQAIIGYWKAIGVNVTLDQLDPATYIPKVIAHQYDGVELLGAPASLMNDPYQLQTFYGSNGGYSAVKDPDMDVLLNKVRASVDPTERAANAKTMAAYMYTHLYGLPIVNTDAIFGVGPKIASYTPEASDPFTALWTGIVAK
jgi:peptide/nickel transport system substrate-binding protein